MNKKRIMSMGVTMLMMLIILIMGVGCSLLGLGGDDSNPLIGR